MRIKKRRTILQCIPRVLKTSHPGEIRTHDLLFWWWRRWPLHHAARATDMIQSKVYNFKLKECQFIRLHGHRMNCNCNYSFVVFTELEIVVTACSSFIRHKMGQCFHKFWGTALKISTIFPKIFPLNRLLEVELFIQLTSHTSVYWSSTNIGGVA
jgi:hypothetical protein